MLSIVSLTKMHFGSSAYEQQLTRITEEAVTRSGAYSEAAKSSLRTLYPNTKSDLTSQKARVVEQEKKERYLKLSKKV